MSERRRWIDSPMESLANIGRGVLMGGADIIPGVSGGTVALILGIYERLVIAISRFDRALLRHLSRREFAAAAAHVDLGFLVTLLVGIGSGALLLGGVMHYLLEHQTQHTFGAFFGLIVGSVWHVKGLVERWTPTNFVLMAAGGMFAYVLVGLPLLQSPPQAVWYWFVCGCVAICAMILPGISGAFILLILGTYFTLTEALDRLKGGEIGGDAPIVLASLGAGAAVGLLTFSKFLRWLFARYEAPTLAVLCGFMIGSLRRIWPFKRDLTPEKQNVNLKQFSNLWPDLSSADAWLTIVIAVTALAFVLLLECWTRREPRETK